MIYLVGYDAVGSGQRLKIYPYLLHVVIDSYNWPGSVSNYKTHPGNEILVPLRARQG